MAIPAAAASLANEANALFVDEDYDGALGLYTEAIAEAPQCAELYVSRAAVYLKMDDFTKAIGDANKAIGIDPNNAKAYLRKGIACFHMDEYATAKTAFEKGRDLDPSTSQFKTWIRKCNAELEDEMVIGEGAPSASKPSQAASNTSSSSAVVAPAAVAPPAPKPVQRFRHDFIQNATHVTVSVYIKGAAQDNCQVEFEGRLASLDWTISKDDSWQLAFDPLFDEIVPEECTLSFFSTKVEIKLKKKHPGKWDGLERKMDEKPLDELTEEVRPPHPPK